MNYILRKVNCKALILSAFVILLTFTSVTAAYAYTIRRIPSFWFDGKNVFYAEGVSPRQSSYTSVSIGYDNLASLVYYCNENGLSTTLAYNSSLGVYVGWVYDDAFKITSLGVSLASGLLCNSDGKIYTAERENSTSVTVNNFNQTIINNSSGSASGSTGSPYVSSSWQEKELLGKIYEKLWFINEWLQITKDWVKEVNYNVKNVNTNINNNVVPALVAINRNLSSMLTDTVSRLSSIQSASWASVDAENRILSTLTGIGNQLGSVIRNGQIQVNTSPIEARLDKLISMYSKVNSVVLDTASVNGGQITGAVGGELQDVIFWGDTAKSNDEFLTSDGLRYRLGPNVGNTTLTTLDDSIVLRSVPVSASFDGDSVVSAGIWQKGSSRILSDTYNATTGVYIQRVGIIDLGSLPYVYLPYPFNSNFSLYNTQTEFLSMRQDIDGGDLLCSGLTSFAGYISSDDNPNKSISSNHNGYLYIRYDEAANSTELLDYVSGMQLLYPLAVPIIQQFDPSTIAIPEGDSAIAADYLRITGKYETYESFTQTADIISGIGRTEALLSSINTALTSVIKDGKLKVDNSDIVTALAEMDNLPGIKTAVEGINIALTSVIADGQVKVDNSAVVAALAKLPNIDTSVASIKSYTSSIKTTTSTISTNVGKVNTTISSVISQGKLKVDNSAVVTALDKLDKLDELPTIKAAVDGVNTTISSVISQGKLKVDNSAVVAAIDGIQAGSAADLSPVVVRMDAILAELQSAPGSAACEHTYTQHTEQEATCTLPGLLIFTCSQCGDSYSEIVDPLGHDWIVTSHVDAVTDPETGEETASAYDVYTCSRCQRTYEDHDGSGPEEDYSSSSISKLVVKVFSRLGTFAGKLIGSVIHLFDKAITALDNVVSKFNEYVEQISGFGGGYPAWLTGFWGVLPAELQVALTFAVICMALGVVGKKLFFS